MNKTILIAGGASVVSLAVGTAGGYFVAKKRFEKQTSEEVAREVAATKKYYSVLLMQAKEQKPDSPEDLSSGDEELEEQDPEEEELSTRDKMDIINGRSKLLRDNKERNRQANAERALVDYNKISTVLTTENTPPVTQNVFDQAASTEKPKKRLPPRGPGGTFRKPTVREEEHEPPQIIDDEAFLLNDMNYNQESLLYFVHDKTLVLEADPSEAVDINLIGEVNLTLFPEVEEHMISMLYVQNDGMSTSYEIKLMNESLTDYIGLGENGGEELDDSEYL